MAEVVGTVASVITLIGLLKGCIDACELIRAAKDYRAELERCDLKLALEQCRLKTWGKSMGLIRDGDAQKGHNLLEHFEFRHVVQEALQQIINLLTNSDRLSKKYGAQKMSGEQATLPGPDSWRSSAAFKLTTAFNRLRVHETIRDRTSKAVRTSVWVFYDQKKYATLIEELRTLVDAVENVTRDIVTREQQNQLFISRLNTISDVRTLNMLTEVCEVDHPAFSDAASVRAEVISFSTTRKGDVSDWINNVTSDSDERQTELPDDVENWDLEDFRRQYLALLNIHATKSRTKAAMADLFGNRDIGGASDGDGGSRDDDEDDDVDDDEDDNFDDYDDDADIDDDDMNIAQAQAYVNEIKSRFIERPEIYRQFLEILQSYQRDLTPIQDVYGQITSLFESQPDLQKGFKRFLPGSANQTGKQDQRPESPSNQETEESMTDIDIRMRALLFSVLKNSDDLSLVKTTPPVGIEGLPVLQDALDYLDRVKLQFADNLDRYHKFLDTLLEFRAGRLDTIETISQVKTLLAGHQELLSDFATFLPPRYSMEDESDHSDTQTSTSTADDGAMAVNTVVPDTAALSEITAGLDMNDAETLRFYTELSMYKYSMRRDTLVLSAQLGLESRGRVVEMTERLGLAHEEVILKSKNVQLLVRRRQHVTGDDDKDDKDDADDDGHDVRFEVEESRGEQASNGLKEMELGTRRS
ncbi:prion-inhibition and propagation-domain-containing protein [Nemania sp. NC0429]|nr:prion-inhibition and propagation-domain-containing protein [Nemania sp. NC0429]